MADKNDYYEFLYAYSLGCLDKDDLINLKNFLDTNEDYYWQELGEFQNLSSLLPSILPVEKPGPEVKDKVARKLYRIRNEIKTKRDKLKKEKKASETIVEKAIEPKKEEILPVEKPRHNTEDFEIVTSKETVPKNLISTEGKKEEPNIHIEEKSEGATINIEKKPEAIRNRDTDTTGKSKAVDSVAKEKSRPQKAIDKTNIHRQSSIRQIEKAEKIKSRRNLFVMILFLAMLILLAILGYLYFKFSSNTKKYEARINTLNQNVSTLNERFSQNKDFLAVLSSKSLKTVNLSATDIAKNTSGRLFISLDTNHGFIQVSNLPKLQNDEVYQLWIYIYDNYLSLAKFKPTDNLGIFPLDTPQLSENSKVSFILTEEPSNGSIQPGKKIYMTGSF
jgi:Anti-sigma-K factor rskA, C-terminal